MPWPRDRVRHGSVGHLHRIERRARQGEV